MGYGARGAAARSLGANLMNIGRFVAGRRADDQARADRMAREDLEFATYVTERGGGVGTPPVLQAHPRADMEDPTGASPLTMERADPRFATIPREGRTPGYILRPEERPDAVMARQREERLVAAADAQADRDRAAAEELRRRPVRTAGGSGGGTPRPTVQQAWNMVRERYQVVADVNGRPTVTGYSKPEDEMYAEALELAGGKGMRPPAPPPPDPVAPPIAAAPPAGPSAVSRTLSGIGRMLRTGAAAMYPGRGGATASAPSAPAAPEPTGGSAVGRVMGAGGPTAAAATEREPAAARPDTAGFGAAQARARQLQQQGKSAEEIVRIMTAEGFKVTL